MKTNLTLNTIDIVIIAALILLIGLAIFFIFGFFHKDDPYD